MMKIMRRFQIKIITDLESYDRAQKQQVQLFFSLMPTLATQLLTKAKIACNHVETGQIGEDTARFADYQMDHPDSVATQMDEDTAQMPW